MMGLGSKGKTLALALAVAAIGSTAGAVAQHYDRMTPALVDQGERRPAPRKPRNREERRGDAHEARKRRKQERQSNNGKAARRLRGRA